MKYKFSIRVVVADDHSIVREGLVLILNNQDDMTVVGECGDEKQAVELVLRKNPDVAISICCRFESAISRNDIATLDP